MIKKRRGGLLCIYTERYTKSIALPTT